jgi:hypothetical protein
MTGTLYEYFRNFMTVSRCILVGMRNISKKKIVEKIVKHFSFVKIIFFFSKFVTFVRYFRKIFLEKIVNHILGSLK